MGMEWRHVGTVTTEGVLGLAACAGGHAPAWAPEVGEAVQAAIDAVGDDTGEVWLHVLAMALDERWAGTSVDAWLEHLADLPAVDVMRHVVGVNVPAWTEVVGGDVLESAAAGDAAAIITLLRSERYYGGVAARALATLLALGPEVARSRILAALRAWFDEVVLPCSDDLAERLAGVVDNVDVGGATLETVERLTGFRFEPEPYTDEVILVPHFVRPGWRALTQHHSARVVVYDATARSRVGTAAIATVFAALGEPNRLEILRVLAQEPGGVSDVARGLDMAKSTAHQHLAVLREAGLIVLAGQAWRYRYEVRTDRLHDAVERLQQYLDRQEPT